MPHVNRSELETVITRAADQQDWTVFSADPRVVRKMTKLHGEGRRVGALGREWVVGRPCISLRRPPRLSTEERAARAERMATVRMARP